MQIKHKNIKKDFSIFYGKLKNIITENIGLEEYIINNYCYYNFNIVELSRIFILNYFYKQNNKYYEYSDILTFYKEKDFIQPILKFKDILDIYILKDIDPDFINVKMKNFNNWIGIMDIEYT